jgi:hypothetical protein
VLECPYVLRGNASNPIIGVREERSGIHRDPHYLDLCHYCPQSLSTDKTKRKERSAISALIRIEVIPFLNVANGFLALVRDTKDPSPLLLCAGS